MEKEKEVTGSKEKIRVYIDTRYFTELDLEKESDTMEVNENKRQCKRHTAT